MSKQSQHKDDLQHDVQPEIVELTSDLKRIQADFENYRKRADHEKLLARESGEATAILKLLPLIDNIERAIGYMPADLLQNTWAQSVSGLAKELDKSLAALGLERIKTEPGTNFDPSLHNAIQLDEAATGEKEVVSEELQAGYLLRGRPIRHALVKVTRI